MTCSSDQTPNTQKIPIMALYFFNKKASLHLFENEQILFHDIKSEFVGSGLAVWSDEQVIK